MAKHEFIIRKIIINGRSIRRVVVDEHYKKHKDITDDLIIDLIRLLDGIEQRPEDIHPPYEYFSTLVQLNEKQYRLVWLLEGDELYVGIVTVYRDNRRK